MYMCIAMPGADYGSVHIQCRTRRGEGYGELHVHCRSSGAVNVLTAVKPAARGKGEDVDLLHTGVLPWCRGGAGRGDAHARPAPLVLWQPKCILPSCPKEREGCTPPALQAPRQRMCPLPYSGECYGHPPSIRCHSNVHMGYLNAKWVRGKQGCTYPPRLPGVKSECAYAAPTPGGQGGYLDQ
jgi:hypothetical protein